MARASGREGARRPRVPPEDRLFSLVLALSATSRGLLKSEIFGTVRGYAEPDGRASERDLDNLNRQFERDKDELRRLGIPLETSDVLDGNNNQLTRYFIPQTEYQLPDETRFTPEEFALLGLAGEVWREASLSEDSQHALMKLRALGVEPQELMIGYAPRVRVREPAFALVQRALETRQALAFLYLKPGDTVPRRRLVDVHALVLHEGRWHLHGIDLDTRDARTFLLSRIVGDASLVRGAPLPPPPLGVAEEVLAELANIRAKNIAEVTVAAGSDAEVRLTKRAFETVEKTGVLRLHFTDAAVFADDLAGFGPEVRVLSPSELCEAVRRRLETVLAAHVDADADKPVASWAGSHS